MLPSHNLFLGSFFFLFEWHRNNLKWSGWCYSTQGGSTIPTSPYEWKRRGNTMMIATERKKSICFNILLITGRNHVQWVKMCKIPMMSDTRRTRKAWKKPAERRRKFKKAMNKREKDIQIDRREKKGMLTYGVSSSMSQVLIQNSMISVIFGII